MMVWQVGDRLPPRTFGPVTRTAIVRYVGASGDFNPIHHDDEFARSAGFASVFSPGMLQAGYVASFVTDILGADRVRSFRARFVEQVWPGDTLTCTGAVSERLADPETGEALLRTELVVTRQNNGVAVRAWATFAE